jgi:GT2 family glycosyltransferase
MQLATSLADLVAQSGVTSFEVIVVSRPTDGATNAVIDDFIERGNAHVIRQSVERPGIVAALRAGWERVQGEFVAMCDDDARYPPNWLERLGNLLVNDEVGAVGGPIDQPGYPQKSVNGPRFASVGWFGRATYYGFDRPGVAEPFATDWLPGANMAMRAEIIRPTDFDVDLDAPGSAPGWEMAICWLIRKRGFHVLVDPTLKVIHEPGPRLDVGRGQSPMRTFAYSRNTAAIMLTYLPALRRTAFLAYFWLVGQKESPGIALIPAVFVRERGDGWPRIRSALQGKIAGMQLAHRRAKLR